MAGTGVAARHGILIKDAEALETAHRVRVVAFDKTGTLTEGKPRLVELLAVDGDRAAALRLAAAIQGGSEHPLARAVVAAAQQQGIAIAQPDSVRSIAGRGSEGVVGGASYLIGSARWLEELGVPLGQLDSQMQRLQREGATLSAMVERTRKGCRCGPCWRSPTSPSRARAKHWPRCAHAACGWS